MLRLQPNLDGTYLRAPSDDRGTYRLTGNRDTWLLATLTLGCNVIGTTEKLGGQTTEYDINQTITSNANGSFECVLSSERPAGHAGNWLHLPPTSDFIIVRRRCYDRGVEIEPRIAIERLDADLLRPAATCRR